MAPNSSTLFFLTFIFLFIFIYLFIFILQYCIGLENPMDGGVW